MIRKDYIIKLFDVNVEVVPYQKSRKIKQENKKHTMPLLGRLLRKLK